MPDNAHPGGLFTCVPCFVWQSSHQLGHTPSPAATEELWRLSADVQSLLALSNAPGTASTYMSSLARFTDTLQAHFEFPPHLTLPRGDRQPATEQHILLFIAAAHGRWKTVTVEGTLAAVKWWHIDKGLNSPTDTLDVRRSMHSLAMRNAGTTLGRAVPKLAIPAAVAAFLASWVGQLADEALATGDLRLAAGRSRDALYIALAFAGCLRKSEAASLRRKDVWFNNPASITVHVTRSKTDQHAVGVSVPISSFTASGVPVGATLRRHMELLDKLGVPLDGPPAGHIQKPDHLAGQEDHTGGALYTIGTLQRWLGSIAHAAALH